MQCKTDENFWSKQEKDQQTRSIMSTLTLFGSKCFSVSSSDRTSTGENGCLFSSFTRSMALYTWTFTSAPFSHRSIKNTEMAKTGQNSILFKLCLEFQNDITTPFSHIKLDSTSKIFLYSDTTNINFELRFKK